MGETPQSSFLLCLTNTSHLEDSESVSRSLARGQPKRQQRLLEKVHHHTYRKERIYNVPFTKPTRVGHVFAMLQRELKGTPFSTVLQRLELRPLAPPFAAQEAVAANLANLAEGGRGPSSDSSNLYE